MNSYIVAFFAVLAVANAGVLVGPSAQIIQGPSSRTTVVGPDGSAISAIAPGGQIVHERSVGVVAQTAPLVRAAPVLAYSSPALGWAGQVGPALGWAGQVGPAPVVSAYSAPLVSGLVANSWAGNAVVAGPSGTIVAGRSSPLVSAW